MKKYLVVLLALLMVVALYSGSYADDNDKFAIDGFKIDENSEMWYKDLNEIISTNDTVTAAESGKVFLISNGGGYPTINMTLPAADEGLTYKFVQQGTGTLVELVPNGTDTFLYSTATASDSIVGPATAGASVIVHASSDSVWFVDANGTFTVTIN